MRFSCVVLAALLMSPGWVAAETAQGHFAVTLLKPNLIYLDGQAVSEDQLGKKLATSDKPVVVTLDPEVSLATLHSLKRALAHSRAKDIQIMGAGRWLLDAAIEQRKEGAKQ